ncbi:protease inhibitor I42 family protein [Ferrovibrio sp.]|uniref:protease inhibitor I42 family protein n=1 Tax=Ferrovibrio sp. TaxID=1917215 RepID=UPI00262858FC|nr:protease inhibitor I42 family protein [Ferrovibrio sp.]
MATWRTITVLLLCGLLAGCAVVDKAPVKSLPQDFTLELPQSGGRFVLLQGEEVRIRLPSNRTTGYRWSMVNEAPGVEVLSLAEEPAYIAEGTMPGRGGTEVWHFRATGTGPTILYFVYRRPFEPNGPAAREAIYNFEIR